MNVDSLLQRAELAALRALEATAPDWVARTALRRFITPPRRTFECACHRASESGSSSAADRGETLQVPYGEGLAGRRWGSGPSVLLVHGWGSTFCHYRDLTRALVQRGFSVVAFDAPAHGRSREKRLDAVMYASAIEAARRTFGPFHGAVGHSFGGSCLLLSLGLNGWSPARLVLLSTPASIAWLTHDFATRRRLSLPCARRMRALMQERGLPWSAADLPSIRASRSSETLIIHDELDSIVPFAHGARLARGAGHVEHVGTRGRGHNGLLTEPEVLRRISTFLSDSHAEHSTTVACA